jgi:alkylhydroperoxidase family enzyme
MCPEQARQGVSSDRFRASSGHNHKEGPQVSDGDQITRNRGAVRFVLLALGVPQALIGAWALSAPRSFYDDFPAGTDGWVDVLGPFDEHLVTDVGSLFVGLGVLLAIAAYSLRRSVVLAAAVSWLIFSVPHFIWHVFNLEPYDTVDAVANTITLTWTVLGGLLVLLLLRADQRRAVAGGSDGDGDGAARTTDGAATRSATAVEPVAIRGDGDGDGGDSDGDEPSHPSGPRIEGVRDGDGGLIARGTFAYTRRSLGKVPEPTRVHAHHPAILAGYGALELATERAKRVPHDLKALAATKAAALSGCEFCMDIGSMISAEAGVTEAKLRALPDYSTSSEFSDVEKLVLDFAVGMTRTPVDVPDELFARLREHFDEAQLVELANEIAIENYRGRFNWAFGIGAQGFAEGAFCVRPETVPPRAAAQPG